MFLISEVIGVQIIERQSYAHLQSLLVYLDVELFCSERYLDFLILYRRELLLQVGSLTLLEPLHMFLFRQPFFHRLHVISSCSYQILIPVGVMGELGLAIPIPRSWFLARHISQSNIPDDVTEPVTNEELPLATDTFRKFLDVFTSVLRVDCRIGEWLTLRAVLFQTLKDLIVLEVVLELENRCQDRLTYIQTDLATYHIDEELASVGISKVRDQVHGVDYEIQTLAFSHQFINEARWENLEYLHRVVLVLFVHLHRNINLTEVIDIEPAVLELAIFENLVSSSRFRIEDIFEEFWELPDFTAGRASRNIQLICY